MSKQSNQGCWGCFAPIIGLFSIMAVFGYLRLWLIEWFKAGGIGPVIASYVILGCLLICIAYYIFWLSTPEGKAHRKQQSEKREKEFKRAQYNLSQENSSAKPGKNLFYEMMSDVSEAMLKERSSSKTYVKAHRRKDGTYVKGHYRRKSK